MSILIFMVDNRDLQTSFEDADYVSFTAIINYLYAAHHGYDFLYYKLKNMDEKDRVKKNTVAYNYTLKHYRAAPWGKLPAAYNALHKKYSTVVYIDSDCIFKDFSRTVEDFLAATKNIQGTVEDKPVVFLNNKPWNKNKPCSGFFVMQKSRITTKFLKKWWNYPNEEHNYTHDYEQNSLHKIFEEDLDKIEIKDDWMFKLVGGQYLRHIGSHEGDKRLPAFRRYYLEGLKLSPEDFEEFINKIEVVNYSTASDCKKMV